MVLINVDCWLDDWTVNVNMGWYLVDEILAWQRFLLGEGDNPGGFTVWSIWD